MTKNLKLLAVLLAPALLALSAAFAPARSADAARESPHALKHQQQPAPSPPAAGLTPQERRGKLIYTRGESPSGHELKATVAEVEVPAAAVTCAGCHGARGEGKTEGGVTAGALAWEHLLKPHTHPTGRRHAPFDHASFVKAVAAGLDPDGNELAVAMPRYRMSAEDVADLVAYLKRVASDSDPGLSDASVRVGMVLPTQGPLAEAGAAMRDVLAAFFEDVSARGGVHGRRVELRVGEAGGGDAAATVAAARRLVEQDKVFALVGGTSAGVDRELSSLARESETPYVGPATLLPQTGAPLNRQVFYLLPGFPEQARALVNFAASRPELKKERLALVHTEGELGAATAAAAEDQARKAGMRPVITFPYQQAAFDARQLVQSLRGAGAESVLFLGGGGEELALVRAAADAGWTPHVLLLGTLMSRDLVAGVPAGFKDRIFVAFPSVPGDLTPAGIAELRALQEKYRIAPRHAASQLAAFAAAKIFVEGLRRAGRDLTRERLVAALEGLYDYETGVTPRITFGPARRVGAAGASVLSIDPEKKEFVPAGGWVKAY